MRKLKIAGATVNQTALDWKGNTLNIQQAIQEAKSQGVEFLCFPELSITGYGCEDLFLSEWLPKKAIAQLEAIIPFTTDISVAVGLPFPLNGSVFNTIAVIENGKLIAIIAKQYMARDGVHYEPRWFSPWPGNTQTTISLFGQEVPLGDLPITIKGVKIAFEICEDAWRGKDRPGYRFCSRDQVDLICNPSASHFAIGKTFLRQNEVVAFGSKQFKCTYLYVNLLGNEAGRMIYDGEIMLGMDGKIVATNKRFSYQNYNIISEEIDFDPSNYTKQEVDPDTTDPKMEFTLAVALGFFDYLRKSRAKGFVLSLSGGADSSSIAFLVYHMIYRGVQELGLALFCEKIGIQINPEISKLSIENQAKQICSQILTTAYQSTINSSENTYDSAKHLANHIGAVFYQWDIDEEVKGYTQKVEKVLGRPLSWEKDDIALQNIQARSRSPIIWMMANIEGKLLLTTSNRSEGDVGYTTMDGDTSGSLAPIAGIDKHFLLQWMLWAEKEMPEGLALAKVNSLTPTAELRPVELTQTDEKDLMPYSLLVEIERLAIRDRKSPVEVYQQLKEENIYGGEMLKQYVKKFFRLWSFNQWKRERIAPSFHLDDFNVDPKTWCRFPILSGGFREELEELEKCR
jgi:NAD+ synthase (glutamine-hydrolysing)